MINATSPNQEGVEGTDSEEVWMITEESAILVISTSLLGTILFFLIKEAYFYARSLLVTSRCAIRGLFRHLVMIGVTTDTFCVDFWRFLLRSRTIPAKQRVYRLSSSFQDAFADREKDHCPDH